jgi:guanylate kinase
MTSHTGVLYTISAPSGAGKTSLVNALVARDPRIKVSVSHTTRPKRPVEREGDNYYFVDQAKFYDMLRSNKFLEHAEVYGHFYGTSKNWVLQALNAGDDVILEIDWQGAAFIHQQLPNSIGIFILPPSQQALMARLTERGQDKQEVIAHRLAQAKEDMSHYNMADYLIINNVFNDAISELEAIILSRRLTMASQQQRCEKLLEELLA